MTSKKKRPLADPREQKLNRSQRREFTRRLWSCDPGLQAVHPNAAGIDIGNSVHYVAVPPDRDAAAVRQFGQQRYGRRDLPPAFVGIAPPCLGVLGRAHVAGSDIRMARHARAPRHSENLQAIRDPRGSTR